MNLEQRVDLIKYNFERGGYTIVAKECVGLIEHAFRELFRQHLTRLDEADRLKVQNAESEIGQGQRGMERFTLGELLGVFHKSGFLRSWARVSGKDLRSFETIDLNKLRELRNDFIHHNREATRAEAELLFNFSQALADHTKAIEIDPNQASAYGSRGWVYHLQGDRKKAEEGYLKELELEKEKTSFPLVLLAILYWQDNKQDQAKVYFQQALEAAQKGVKENPYWWRAFYRVAMSQLGIGETEKGLETYRQAIEASKGLNIHAHI